MTASPMRAAARTTDDPSAALVAWMGEASDAAQDAGRALVRWLEVSAAGAPWLALENYQTLLTDTDIWQAMQVTGQFEESSAIFRRNASLSQSQLPKTKWASKSSKSATVAGSSMSPQCSTIPTPRAFNS